MHKKTTQLETKRKRSIEHAINQRKAFVKLYLKIRGDLKMIKKSTIINTDIKNIKNTVAFGCLINNPQLLLSFLKQRKSIEFC